MDLGFPAKCFWLFVAFLMLPPSNHAQEENKEEVTDNEMLKQITVHARKREIDLQSAPVSVSAISGENFEQANVSKLDNFNGYVPNLVISKNDGAGRVVSIRGVGWETAQSLSTQPSVLVYVDGIYLANPLAMGLALGEIEQIEVLRGPQGTEFGQGTTGGAINIITKQAVYGETGGSLGFEAGTFGFLRERASANLVLGDQLAFRISLEKLDRDGFAEIEGGSLDGYELDDADLLTGQFSLNYRPSDRVSVRLSGFLHESDHHGAAQKNLFDPNPDPRRLTQDYPSTFGLDNQSFSLVVEWETPWGFSLKSLTGFQKLEKIQTMDGDRLTEDLTAVDLTGFGPANFDLLPIWDNNSDAFSQELNISGSNGRLDWVTGLYFLDHENNNFFLEAVGPAPFSQFEEQLANPSPETLPPFTPPLEFVEDRILTREDSAVYGQLTYRLTDQWAFTLGGRFQNDESKDVATQFWFNDSEQITEDNAFTWKAGLDFNITQDHFLFLLISTGWKNGGNNPGALVGGALDVPENFEPEEVTSIEIGTRNTLANRTVYLNATAFYYDYENYQFIQEDPIPFSGGTGNIPSVEIYGLELEYAWQINNRLRLDGFAALNDGEILDDFFTLDTIDFLESGFGRFTPTGVADRAGLRVNLAGNVPPKLIERSARAALTHNQPFVDGSVLTSRFEYIYRGEFQYRVFNNPRVDRVPSYAIANLFLGYDLAATDLTFSLTASNLFDEDGVNSRFSNPFGLHTTSEEFIPPREIIGGIRYRF